MGTDIFMYVEKIDLGGTWQLLKEPTDSQTAQYPEIFYGSRNYDLFAILADVRNPTRTADNRLFETIASLRGLPADLSAELHDDTGDTEICWGSSWLLLSEVLQFDWYGKVMCHEAMVDARVAHLFQENKPFPLAQWLPEIEVGYAIYMLDGVTVRWTETYGESAGDFMKFLERLQQQGEPSQIRLVFWFG